MSRTYPKVSHTDATIVPATPAFPAIEEQVLAYWKDDGTFEASVAQRDAGTAVSYTHLTLPTIYSV